GGIDEHTPCPAIHIELLDQSAHALHPGPLLHLRHRQAKMKRGRKLIDVVGIDHERLRQFPSGAGELTQNQYSLLVVPGTDELFGDQIHAVMETADHTEVCSAITLADLRRLMVLNPQADRFISLSPKPLVDL